MRTVGSVVTARLILWRGASTSARPSITTVSCWLRHMQSSVTCPLSRSISATVTRVVMVSPMAMGRLKCSDWSV